jgi:hydroxymethylbilane synthase
MSKLIRIGTFNNKLALSQANAVAALIKPSGYTTEVIVFDTNEKHLTVLEDALLQGTIDIISFHASYIPARLNDALDLLAFTEREAVNDVLISRKKTALSNPGIRVGTNSLRRIAFLRHFYPDVTIVPVPENLSARIKQMEAGEYALLMSYTDAQRLELENRVVEKIETSYFVPTVGQGSIAIVCHKKLSFDKKEIIQRWVNHEETEDCIRTERSFLKTFQDGQRIPAFGYAHFEGNLITLKAGLISRDGKRVIKAKRSSTIAGCKEMGKKVAREVLQNGGAEILRAIEVS